jgi:hypothetical protein
MIVLKICGEEVRVPSLQDPSEVLMLSGRDAVQYGQRRNVLASASGSFLAEVFIGDSGEEIDFLLLFNQPVRRKHGIRAGAREEIHGGVDRRLGGVARGEI